MITRLTPETPVALTGRNSAARFAAAAVFLLGCFTVGVFAVRSTTEGLMLIGALGCFVVYLTGPQRMAWIAMFLAFASLPALHLVKQIGPLSVYAYQVAVLLAILFLIPVARLRFSRYAVPLIFLLAVFFFTAMGTVWGNDPDRTFREASFLCEMAAGFVLALLVVRAGFASESVRAMSVVLWFSAGMVMVSSLTGLQLAGRAESLQGETGVAAMRIITATQAPALAVLTALVVAQILGRAKLSAWLALGLPAFTITALSFSRHALLALAVAAVVAIAAKFSWAVIRRTAVVAVAAIAVVAAVIPAALFLLQRSPAGIWLSEQLNAFSHRVFDGVSTTALEADSSTLARLHENTNLWRAIAESPLFGHGLGYAYQLPFGRPGDFTATLGTTYAHNFYLWLLVKAGIVGIAVFALFALIPVVRAVRAAAAEATIAAAVSAGLLVTCVVNPLPLEPASALVLGMALGAAMAFSRSAAAVPSAAALAGQPPAPSTVPTAAQTSG